MRRLIKKTINLLVSFLIYKKNHKGFFRCIAFFLAVHVFLFSSVYCFCVPVYAVGEEVVLFEGFQSLMFMLGLSADLSSGITQSQWVTQVDSDFSNAIAKKNQEQQDILYDNYAEFKDNLERGYMLITDTLFDFFKDTAYDEYIKPQQMTSNITNTGILSKLGSVAGNYIYFHNVYFDSSRPTQDLLICYYTNNHTDLTSYINLVTPTVLYSNNGYKTIKWGTLNSPENFGTYWWYSYNVNSPSTGGGLANYNQNLTVDISNSIVNSGDWSLNNYGYLDNTVNVSDYVDNLTENISKSTYEDTIDDTFSVGDDGYIYTDSGVLPQVLDDTTVNDIVDDIKTGAKSWTSAITSITDSYPENPALPEDTISLPELDALISDLNLDQIQNKFPFCIPNDIYLIASGAAAVSSNAPVIKIPLHIEFRNTVYYDNNEAVVIDFKMFDPIIDIVRTGFFLLFLIGLIWGTIGIMQSFFQITE